MLHHFRLVINYTCTSTDKENAQRLYSKCHQYFTSINIAPPIKDSVRKSLLKILKATKPPKISHMINRILHSWSFHMKFMKSVEDSFHVISFQACH